MSGTTAFLDKLKEKSGSTTEEIVSQVQQPEPEEVKIEVVEQEGDGLVQLYEEEIHAEPVKQPTDGLEAIYEEEVQPQSTPPQEPEKIKYNVKDYLDTNSAKLTEYLKYKNVKVDEMSPEEVLTLKLKRENPLFSDSDIKDELLERYGIGLEEQELTDLYDSELRDAKEINAKIARGQRLLKQDLVNAKKELNSYVESLELPEIEFEVNKGGEVNPEEIIGRYFEEQHKYATEYKEKTWIPNIQNHVAKTKGFKQKVEVEVKDGEKVVSEITYRFTEDQQKQLQGYLENYVPNPSDDVYVLNQETGEIDYQRFVSDKAKALFVDDIIKASIKEATAKFKEEFVSKDLINYSDEPRRDKVRPQGSVTAHPTSKMFQMSAEQVYGRRR